MLVLAVVLARATGPESASIPLQAICCEKSVTILSVEVGT